MLEINGSRIQAIWDSGKEGYGTIHVAARKPTSSFTSNQIYADVAKQVLVVGVINDGEALQQAERGDINGLIAGSITADLIPLAQSLNFPIFITNGIGQEGMAQPIFDLMLKSEAREVALFTAPHGQSGGRPEIVIPLEAVSKDTVPPADRPLAVGHVVRIIRSPHANQTGTVVHIYQGETYNDNWHACLWC